VSKNSAAQFGSAVQFEEANSKLTAVKIVQRGRRPLIGAVHRSLLALGVVISSYEIHAGSSELTERLVFERDDGGEVEASLSDETKAAILRVAREFG
jgi:hypothetical protein